eukprot:12318-Heterococcus_DN1.PRE.2
MRAAYGERCSTGSGKNCLRAATALIRRPACGRAAQWHGCCTALASTTTGCLLLAAGACEHSVRALQQHYSTRLSADFAQHGCRAVYHLAQTGSSSIERLGTACACEAVVGSLAQYVAVAAVAQAACNAVQLLAYKTSLQCALSLHASNASLVWRQCSKQ